MTNQITPGQTPCEADCGRPDCEFCNTAAGRILDDLQAATTRAAYAGLTHACDDPECHVPGFIQTLQRKERDPDPIIPERVTLTEADEARLSVWLYDYDRDPAEVEPLGALVERILADRICAAGEREAQIRALADNPHCPPWIRSKLRALLAGDEETTP